MKMKIARICDLTEWPPQPGEATSGRGEILYAGTNETFISTLYRVDDCRVEFGCTFAGKLHSYVYNADTAEIAKKVGDVIGSNPGKSLAEIGLAEIEI